MAHNYYNIMDPFRVTIMRDWLLFFMVIAVLTLLIVRIKNHIRGKAGLSFTMPPALKFVNLSLIARCILIWAGITDVVILIKAFVSGSKFLPSSPLPFFLTILMVILIIFGIIALLSILSLSIFLPVTSMISVLLTRAKVRSATLIMLALLPVPFIAFIGPYHYMLRDSHNVLASRTGIDIGLGIMAIPSVLFWAIGIRRGAYRTTESGRLPPSEESGPEEGST